MCTLPSILVAALVTTVILNVIYLFTRRLKRPPKIKETSPSVVQRISEQLVGYVSERRRRARYAAKHHCARSVTRRPPYTL